MASPGAYVPPQAQEMARNAVDAIEPLTAVSLRQHLHLAEVFCDCCERRNRYRLSAIPHGRENKQFDDKELREFPLLLDVREQSTLCCRFCCGQWRALKIGFFPSGTAETPRWPNDPPTLLMDRPFRCTCWCGRLCNPQELSIEEEGRHLGKAQQECRCFDFCCLCTNWMRTFDATGRDLHVYEKPTCGRNCCAPSCLNYVLKIRILDARDETRELGWIKNIWPGWNCRGCCSASTSNLVVKFPDSASKEEKAVVLGATFLHEFMHFENRNDDN